MIGDVKMNRFPVMQTVTVSTASRLRPEFASDVNASLAPLPPAGLECASILVVSAVPQELSGVSRSGADGRVRWIAGGIGPRAGAAVRQQLAQQDFSLVVSTGFAGGARPGFRVGDLVMATEVVHAGSGHRRRPADGPAGLQGICSAGAFVTVERPLREPLQKQEAGARYGAIAVDMETAGVAEAAEGAGVPWMALRAILDPMEVPLAAGSGAQALALALRPGRWGELKNFWVAIRKASESLGRGLELFTCNSVPGLVPGLILAPPGTDKKGERGYGS